MPFVAAQFVGTFGAVALRSDRAPRSTLAVLRPSTAAGATLRHHCTDFIWSPESIITKARVFWRNRTTLWRQKNQDFSRQLMVLTTTGAEEALFDEVAVGHCFAPSPSSRSAPSCCTFFRGNSGISPAAGAMNNYLKYLLDGALVVLIIGLVWTGMRRWTNNRNNDRPD